MREDPVAFIILLLSIPFISGGFVYLAGLFLEWYSAY